MNVNNTITFNAILTDIPPKKGWEGYFLFFTGSYFRIQDEKEILYLNKNKFTKKWNDKNHLDPNVTKLALKNIIKTSPTLLPVYTIRSWFKMDPLLKKDEFIRNLPEFQFDPNKKAELEKSQSLFKSLTDDFGAKILSIDTNRPTKWDSIALKILNQVFEQNKNKTLTAEKLITDWANSLTKDNPNKDKLNKLLNLQFTMIEIQGLLNDFYKNKGSSN